MLWLYERGRTSMWLETRYDTTTAEYVGLVHHPDGRRESHRFNCLVAFREWLLATEATLTADRWTINGAPDILPDGWPDKLQPM
jgi:hypothetical protein